MPKQDNSWKWFALGAVAAIICVFAFWGTHVVVSGFRIHHYWLLVLVPVGYLFTLSNRTKNFGMFILAFGLVAGMSDFPDLYQAIVGGI